MTTLVALIILWVICSVPFATLGLPPEFSLIPGAILEIFVIGYLGSRPDSKSSHPTQRGDSSYNAPNDDYDDIDEMIELDMMDGKLDGKFGFFDED